MAILGGLCFLHFWPKNPLSGSKFTFMVIRVKKFSQYSHLEGFLAISEESRPPNLNGQFWGVYFLSQKRLQSLDICMLRLNLKRHPSVPGLIEKNFSLKYGFNLPNFTTLGGCPLKNWTFVQKLLS